VAPQPSRPAVRLLLVRHGESANRARATGATAALDPELSELGFEQAEALGRHLAKSFRRAEAGDVLVASSPMRRCLLTIRPTVHRLRLAPEDCLCHGACYEFACVGAGFTGTTREAIAADFPEFRAVGFSAAGTWDYRGASARETEAEACDRGARVAEWLRETARGLGQRPGERPRALVLSAHQTLADLLCRLLLEGSSEGWAYGDIKYRLRNAGITELLLSQDGLARPGARNDTSHLLALNADPGPWRSPQPRSAKRIAELRALFTRHDRSGDYKLDFAEMSTLLRQGNPSLSDKELRALFDGVDSTSGGDVSFDEFVKYIHSTSDPG